VEQASLNHAPLAAPYAAFPSVPAVRFGLPQLEVED